MEEPRTRNESRKTAKEKRRGKEQLGSSKGARMKEANIERGINGGSNKKGK
jgi:hypothetical protein